jgi:hypothetical protein
MKPTLGIILSIFAIIITIFGILRAEDKQLVFNLAFPLFALGMFAAFAAK